MFQLHFRTIKTGFKKFWRNGWLSAATVLMMVLTLIVVNGLILISVITNTMIGSLQNKIDVSVYFKIETSEDRIHEIRNELLALGEVKSIEYVSRDVALEKFKEKHTDNEFINQSLEELSVNPLQASLNVKANMASQYESIAQFLGQAKYQEVVDKVNFKQNQRAIEKLSNIIMAVKKFGLGTSMVLSFIAVLIAFNTIRLAIFTSREEISIMRLVGASNWFVRGPFLIEGIIYGLFAAIITLAIYYPVLWSISPKITDFIPGTDIFFYYKQNFWQFFAILSFVGIMLGVIGSFIAIGRYLKKD